MIAKAVATQCEATFFNISASSLTSKYVGEGEKLVKALFSIAREKQPSIIFIDEIDSILSSRSSDDNEASKRIKTEFLIAFDGVGSEDSDKILVMAATNLPDVLDEAVKRRFARRIYVPMPDPEVRWEIIRHMMSKQKLNMSKTDMEAIISRTDGYSASDLKELCRDAAMVPLRYMDPHTLSKLTRDQVPAVNLEHFLESLQNIKPTVSKESVRFYEQWNDQYGSKLSSSKRFSEEKSCKIS
jgi:SpoVK/Ycf46/Vps4 family AAA+-type ATPase